MLTKRIQQIEHQLYQSAPVQQDAHEQLDSSNSIENLKGKIASLESMISEIESSFKMPEVGLQSVGEMISFCKDKIEEHDKEFLLLRASRTAELSYEETVSDTLAELKQQLLLHGDHLRKHELDLSQNAQLISKLEFDLSQMLQLFDRVENCESMLAKHQTTIPVIQGELKGIMQNHERWQNKIEMISMQEPCSGPTSGMNLGLSDADAVGESELSWDERLSSIENALILLLEAPDMTESENCHPEGQRLALQASPADENRTRIHSGTRFAKTPVKTLFDHIARIEEVSRILCHHGTAIRTIQSNQASWKDMTMKVTDCISLVSSLVSDIKILRHGEGGESQSRLEGHSTPASPNADVSTKALNSKLYQIQEILEIAADGESWTSIRLNALDEAIRNQHSIVQKLNEDLQRWSCSLEKTLEVANEAFGDQTPFAIRSYVDCIEEDVKDCHKSIAHTKEELLQSQNNFELQLYALEQEMSQRQDSLIEDLETLKSTHKNLSNGFAEVKSLTERSLSDIGLRLVCMEEAMGKWHQSTAEDHNKMSTQGQSSSGSLEGDDVKRLSDGQRGIEDEVLGGIYNRIASLEALAAKQTSPQAEDEASLNSMESDDESPTSRSESMSYNAQTFSSRMSQSSVLRKLREDFRELKKGQHSMHEQVQENLLGTFATCEDLLAVENSLQDALKAYDDALADIRAMWSHKERRPDMSLVVEMLQDIPRIIDVIEELITEMRMNLSGSKVQGEVEGYQTKDDIEGRLQRLQDKLEQVNANAEEMSSERVNLRNLENLVIELEAAMETRETENAFLDERVEKTERTTADLVTRVSSLEEKAIRVADLEHFKAEISREGWLNFPDSPWQDKNNKKSEQEPDTAAGQNRIKALAARVRDVMSTSESGHETLSPNQAAAKDLASPRRLLAETAAEIQQWEIRTFKENTPSDRNDENGNDKEIDLLEFV
eukprot:767322-Hanusia_phi.AAC.2